MRKQYIVKINGVSYRVEIEDVPDENLSSDIGEDKSIRLPIKEELSGIKYPGSKDIVEPGDIKGIKAPMAGTILRIEKKEGQNVEVGEVILKMEAMKMETSIISEYKGIIHRLYVHTGEAVKPGVVLVEIKV